MAMDDLCDDVFKLVLVKLSLLDSIRARAVCSRWRTRIDVEGAHCRSAGPQSYCPLVFKRDDEQHTWSGYDSTTGHWEALPPLSNVPGVIKLLPIAGSGQGLLGFAISTQFSGYTVGDPFAHKWKALPKSDDCWGEAAMFMVADKERNMFRVVAVGVGETQIYHSDLDTWTRVGGTPRTVTEQTVSHIKNKQCAALCSGRLYSVGESRGAKALVWFDIRTEKWTDDCISMPAGPPRSAVQLAECAGALFAVIEGPSGGAIAVWGLKAGSRRFSPVVEMPEHYRSALFAHALNSKVAKLKSVGHKDHLFFWRHKSPNVVAFHLLTRTWDLLPPVEWPPGAIEVVVDAGFFEPIVVSG